MSAQDKIDEIEAQINVLQQRVNLLKAQDGKVARFLDSITSEGTLPDLPRPEIIARIVYEWERFEN